MPDHGRDAHPMTEPALLLAHQGGWDEILLVVVPIAIFAGLLAMANRRANRQQAERHAAEASDPE
mgnify:CR=1 FL=1